jgi:nitrite reductase/ring-hydroxylating ferredoxin subunit
MTDECWHFAANAGDVKDDVPTLVTVGDLQIALCRLGDEFFAIDNICTHEFACLTDGFIEDDEVECPLHQARFQIRTGKAMSAPATEDLRTYSVIRMEDGIFVNVEA